MVQELSPCIDLRSDFVVAPFNQFTTSLPQARNLVKACGGGGSGPDVGWLIRLCFSRLSTMALR